MKAFTRSLASAPKFSGRGQFNPETQKQEYIQEHDYTVTPETYLYLERDNQEMFQRFPLVTHKVLEQRQTSDRPSRVRMLARDFIDNSLYSSKYGYFSKAAEIYSPGLPFDFSSLKNADDFLDVWAKDFGSKVMEPKDPSKSAESQPKGAINLAPKMRQMWHTPTELFHPYYGQALANYLVKSKGSQPLCIYEMGAGNGTLMTDIMDYLRAQHPQVYKTTTYNIIEISPSLALRQKAKAGKHKGKVTIHNKSIFEWNQREERPCFFIALEVWDNFSHDVVRYDNTNNTPHQGYVVVDQLGDFVQIFSEKLDTPLKRALALQEETGNLTDSKLGAHPLKQSKYMKYLKNYFKPSKANLSAPEFVPTKYVDFLHVLKDYFPQHSLLASDFTHFGDRIPGYCSPVVQTFVDGQPVTVSTFMVLQGFFDIMFPTDFKASQALYERVTGKRAQVSTHSDFLNAWANLADTNTKTGENPMTSFYRNAAFMVSDGPSSGPSSST